MSSPGVLALMPMTLLACYPTHLQLFADFVGWKSDAAHYTRSSEGVFTALDKSAYSEGALNVAINEMAPLTTSNSLLIDPLQSGPRPAEASMERQRRKTLAGTSFQTWWAFEHTCYPLCFPLTHSPSHARTHPRIVSICW